MCKLSLNIVPNVYNSLQSSFLSLAWPWPHRSLPKGNQWECWDPGLGPNVVRLPVHLPPPMHPLPPMAPNAPTAPMLPLMPPIPLLTQVPTFPASPNAPLTPLYVLMSPNPPNAPQHPYTP